MEDKHQEIVYSTRDSFEARAAFLADEEMQKLYKKKRESVENKSENKSENDNYYWDTTFARSLVKSIGGKEL